MPTPVALIILDGFGLAPKGPGNAVDLANTPNFDTYWANYPHTQLQASGSAVGLPEGQMGNSEVGHMNIGAGRVVMQSLSYIQHQIDTGSFFNNDVLNNAFDNAQNAVHLMGLVSDGGVHSDIKHLFALLELAKQKGKPTFVHVFTDGRDTAPDSALGFVQALERKMTELGHGAIASVSGRYFAMDRDNRWDRVKQAYDTVVCGQAEFSALSAEQAVRDAHARGETDEFVKPTVIVDANELPVGTIHDGDSVVFFNFRADRARQLTYALLGDSTWQAFERCKIVNVHYASLMEYDRELNTPYAFALPEIKECLAEVISEAGLPQYHTAETEKYPHVTFFFNAEREEPFKGEERKIVPSPQDVPTYDYKPEMSAAELTQATLKRLNEHDDAFILLNFANPDMVGHTGVIEAAIKACEAADKGLGALVNAVLAKDGAVIVIADHGNAEKMLTEDGKPHTAHTTNPVPCILISKQQGLKLRDGGVLGDVAPTVLQLIGLKQPDAMTGTSLIQ